MLSTSVWSLIVNVYLSSLCIFKLLMEARDIFSSIYSSHWVLYRLESKKYTEFSARGWRGARKANEKGQISAGTGVKYSVCCFQRSDRGCQVKFNNALLQFPSVNSAFLSSLWGTADFVPRHPGNPLSSSIRASLFQPSGGGISLPIKVSACYSLLLMSVVA